MKRQSTIQTKIAAWCVSLLLAAGSIVGCNDQSTVQGKYGQKLTLVEPSSVTLNQGAMNEVKITIKRDGLTGPVAISFDKLPAGVTTVDADKKIIGDEGAYVLKADETAALVTDHQAQVTATSTDGIAVSQNLKITVKQMKAP